MCWTNDGSTRRRGFDWQVSDRLRMFGEAPRDFTASYTLSSKVNIGFHQIAANTSSAIRLQSRTGNNAGMTWVPLQRDSRGIESQLATNYLGQYQLVTRLWPALKKANGARVVNVSSSAHHMGSFNFDDPNFEHTEYNTLVSYGQSKTATNLFTVEVDNRAKGFNVRAYSLHPGEIAGTELARGADMELFKQLGYADEHGNIRPEILANLKTILQGAATTVWCATSPLLNEIGGVYCDDADIAGLASGSIEQGNGLETQGVQPYSVDENNARRLWDLSEKLTGITFHVK